MSENEGYENLSEEQKEKLRKLRARTRLPVENPQELTITAELDPKILAKNEWFNRQATRLAKELTESGQNTDSSEITPENFSKKVAELRGLKQLRREASIEADPTRKTSSGTLTLSGQTAGSEDEWNSVEELIDDLQTIRHSKDKRVSSAQKKEAEKILKELTRKTLAGMTKEEKYHKVVQAQDTEPMIKKLNREYRKRRGIKDDEE